MIRERQSLGSVLLACCMALAVPSAQAQAPSAEGRAGGAAARRQAAAGPAAKRETFASWHARRGLRFQRSWGVDLVGVRPVSSGYMLRFDYRVVDPAKAAALTDRGVKPYLIDEATRTALAVPAMENIGELRQVAPLVPNRTYFIIFGNPGKLVKRGSRVTLVVGNLRAEGLVVD